jgi:hypothetical protein
MMIGGNQKFKEFLQTFDLCNDNIHHKYKTNAAKFYRENLDNITKGRDVEQPPDFDKGRELFHFQSKMDSGGLMAFGSDDLVQDERQVESGFKQNWEKGKKKMSTWGMSIGRGFNSLVEKTKKKFESKNTENEQETPVPPEPQEKSATREKFDKGIDSFKKGMGTLGNKISLGWSMFSSKTKELAQDSKRFIQETKEKYSSNKNENENKYESGEKPQGPDRGMMDEDVYERKAPEYEDKTKKKEEEEEVNYI